jgi:glucokinase
MQSKDLSIGIDIGGTNTSFGVVNRRGDILWEGLIKTRDYASPEKFIEELRVSIAPEMAKRGRNHFIGAGIGAPNGNYYTGRIELAANLPWNGIIPFRDMAMAALELPVVLTNDANATAIGEMIYGSAKGMKDFLVVTLGTGLGSGFVANGRLIYGHDGFAGELGHTIAIREGRPCGCGRRGCLETYASATGIVTTAIEFLQQEKQLEAHPDIWLSSVWRARKEVSAKDIFNAAEAGDPLALSVFDYTGKILGQSLADAVAITSPKAIIFFGGLAQAGRYILDPTKKYMEENLLQVFKNKIDMLLSGLGEKDAAILGAAALAWA